MRHLLVLSVLMTGAAASSASAQDGPFDLGSPVVNALEDIRTEMFYGELRRSADADYAAMNRRHEYYLSGGGYGRGTVPSAAPEERPLTKYEIKRLGVIRRGELKRSKLAVRRAKGKGA